MQLPNPPNLPYDPSTLITDKKYKELVNTMQENEYFQAVRQGINALQINQKLFKSLQGLISFFKFPILIHLKTPIMKILSSPKLLDQYEKDIKKIAKIAQDIIGQDGRIYQLDFLFQKGIDETFYKKIEIKQEKRKFINYIKKLSQQKRLLEKKLKDRRLTQKDILEFQSLQYDTELKYLQGYFENYIKAGVKQIEQKFQLIKKEDNKNKNKNKNNNIKINKPSSSSQQEEENSFQQQQKQQQQKALSTSNKQSNITNQQAQQQQQTFLCCRRSFNHKQLIQQPQSINFIYKYWRDLSDQANHPQLLKSICGLLNSQGGYVFVGIKEDKNTYKKQVQGYTIIEREKQQYRRMVDQLVDKCILPTISHDMLKILFVPIKNKQTNQFISGRFLIKISVRYGQRKQFYSFKQHPQSKKEYFTIRTDNDTKLITNGQEILNIYKNRLLQTPSQPKPIHKDQCPKPQIGKLLYEIENFAK